MRAGALAIAAIVGLTAGCRNSCQEVCVRMADYAEECGFTVPEAELDACIEAQASDLDAADKQACREFGTPELIRNEWTCDDLALYWGADEGGGDAR